MTISGVITVNIDPYIELGPITLAWHGLTIAIGLLIGAWVATRVAEQYGLPTDRMSALFALVTIAGVLGGRLLYLAEHDGLLHPDKWLGTYGFSFNGGFAFAALAAAIYVRKRDCPCACSTRSPSLCPWASPSDASGTSSMESTTDHWS